MSVLHPSLLLNELCGVVKERLTKREMEEDAADILFLVSWLGSDEEKVRWGDVPNVTRAFAAWFVEEYKGEELWRKVFLTSFVGDSTIRANF